MPFRIIRNDITAVSADAIVNPTNSAMRPGGGVDAAIHRAAGKELREECRSLAPCAPGEVKVTKGYQLRCRYILHTVGPRWLDGTDREREILADCYRNCLNAAKALGCRSIALPLIGSGHFGIPRQMVLYIALEEIRKFLQNADMDICLVVYDEISFRLSREQFPEVQAFIDRTYIDTHPEQRRFGSAAPDSALYETFQGYGASFAPEEPMVCPPQAAPRSAEKACRPHASRRRSSAKESASLEDWLKKMDESFSQMLLRKIDEKGMTDSQCYKKACIDRKLFSKIRSDPNYRPSKSTVIAFIIALELPLEEANDMLRKAGFALSRSSRFDVIIEYYLTIGCYDLFRINETLFAFDQVLLGTQG